MSTFLQLVNRLAVEAGVTGSASAVSTTVAQTGEAGRLVGWIRTSHTEIQSRHNWRWMRSTFSVPTVSGTDAYAYGACTDTRLSSLITRFKRWIPFSEDGAPNMTQYLASTGVSGEMYMTYLPWENFRSIYKRGTQNNGQPVIFTIDPQNRLVFGPKPDAIYTVQGEYQMSALVFAADSDVPEMPSDYHDLIVYRAMEKYGTFHEAPEVLARGQREGARVMRQMEATQLPQLVTGQPLA